MTAEIIASVEAALQSISVAAASGGQIGLQNLWGDDFIVYLSFPAPPEPEVLEALASSILTEVQMRIRSQVPASASIRFHTAHTMIEGGHGSPSSRIYQAVQRAMQRAKGSLHREAEAKLQEFDNLIAQQHLHTVYQPIVSLISAQVLGWEALIRGPAQSRFQTPDALFQYAEETNRMWTLERACRQAALRGPARPSAHRFLLFLADVKLTMAHHANPLTGMPGNPAIYDEIANRLRSGQRFSVVYLDLNFFTDYNDAYGFACGDQALLFTARLTTRIATRYGGRNPFIGHVGGDDFVIVLEPIHSDDVCRRLIKLFDRVAPRFHSAEERKAGKMMGQDRLGGRIELPLLSVAVAAVSVAPTEYDSPEAIARASARAKRQAKAHLGSHYVNLGANTER